MPITGADSVFRIAAWNEKDLAHGIDPGATFFQEWTNGRPTINDGPNGLQLLDQDVKAAEAGNIKLIMGLTKLAVLLLADYHH